MSMKIPTPHITAKQGDFGKTVLMPGDPLRAKFIAETFLENPVLVNPIRGVNGYTGTYKGIKVSVMASGMGMASMGIYSYELYNAYGVENILRIGTAGAIHKDLPVKSLVFGMGACTNSNYGKQYNLPGTYAPIASYELLKKGVEIADKRTDVNYKVGNLFSSDTFYDDAGSGLDWAKMGVLAIEMEAAALYMNAARAGKNAMALCTISDNIVTGEAATAEERQTTFTTMMEIALDLAVEMN